MMKYGIIVLAALIIAAVIFAIIKINDKKKRGQSSQQYLQMFSQLYDTDEKSVIDSLREIKEYFKSGSVEYIAVDKSIFYLTQSIVRDYATAFIILEKVFNIPEVKQFHAKVIEHEKENIILLLQQPKKEQSPPKKKNKK